MRDLRELVDLWVDLRTASRGQLRARLVILGGALLFVLSLVLVRGGGPVAWAAIALLGLCLMLQPHTLTPALLFLVFGVASWWVGVEGPWHWALLPAALGLLLVHTGAALAASAPAQAPVPESVQRRWAVRVGVVAAATAGVWALSGVLVSVSSGRGGAVPGIIGLALFAGVLLVYLRRIDEA